MLKSEKLWDQNCGSTYQISAIFFHPSCTYRAINIIWISREVQFTIFCCYEPRSETLTHTSVEKWRIAGSNLSNISVIFYHLNCIYRTTQSNIWIVFKENFIARLQDTIFYETSLRDLDPLHPNSLPSSSSLSVSSHKGGVDPITFWRCTSNRW